jgi:hypothetical protein
VDDLVKRLSIVMIAFLLFAGITPAFADEGVTPELNVSHEADHGVHVVKATVPDAEEVSGTYTFTGVGEEVTNETGEVRYEGLEAGSYQVEVAFEGAVDGTEVTLNGNFSFDVAAEEEDGKEETGEDSDKEDSGNAGSGAENGDHGSAELMVYPFFFVGEESGISLTAEVLGKGKGTWSFTLDGKEPEEWYSDYDEEEGVTYAEAFYTVAKPGTHQAVVTFKGTIDGKEVDLKEELTVDFPSFGFEITYDQN